MTAIETGNTTVMARTFARTARDAFTASADLFRSLPDDAWSGPTGCAKWDMRALANHIVGEAVWFPNLVRGSTRGETPLPAQTYEDHRALTPGQLADTTEESAGQIESAIDEATSEQLEGPVDLGFAKLPIWKATYISMLEGVFHNWDVRARRETGATIRTPWALQLVTLSPEFAPFFAHQQEAAAAQGTYRLNVGDGIGPVTVLVADGAVTVERGAIGTPDVSVGLTADQYVRLIAGRFDLATEGRDIPIEGDRERVAALGRLFAGIANG